ncbi:MAG: hypothetical protein K8F31_05805 [Roseovarius sp.]|nr:hypothetical protein [Roseovarius sp.]
MSRLGISVAFLFALVFSPYTISNVHAQSSSFDVDKAIAAGDHKGLAEYYKSQAEAQRTIAAMHDKMKTAYRNTHVHYKGSENVMAGHCGDLKFQALKMAEQYDALAKEEGKLSGAGPVASVPSGFDVEKAIAGGDHKGLAEYYKSQAEAQRKTAEMHDQMKIAYRNSHVHYKGSENVMASHCGDLKFQALKMAEQYDALAKQEEKLAQGK